MWLPLGVLPTHYSSLQATVRSSKYEEVMAQIQVVPCWCECYFHSDNQGIYTSPSNAYKKFQFVPGMVSHVSSSIAETQVESSM